VTPVPPAVSGDSKEPKALGAAIFRRTRAKHDVLAALAEFYCLRPKDLARLSRNREPTESDIRSINATLKLLREQNLVRRIPYFDSRQYAGTITYVYGLNHAATRKIGEPARYFDDHSVRTLEHELEISLFHIALKMLCQSHRWELHWRQDAISHHRSVNPDASFVLTKPERGEANNKFAFFLEIERSKIGNFKQGEPSIVRKLTRYASYFDAEQCERDWGFRKFRILLVQPSETRKQHLLRLLHERLNHRMFWLTTEPLYKANIGGRIFHTPKDHEKVAYSLLQL
jgi:hypothetical protein